MLEAAQAMFAEDFAGRVFGFESDATWHFVRIAARRWVLGKPINHADAQIAAIARREERSLPRGISTTSLIAALS